MNGNLNNRKAVVFLKDERAGILEETGHGYRFTYEPAMVERKLSISVSLPARMEPYESDALFPFFQGLLPEGWYLDLVTSKLKIEKRDSFGILLATCKDTIGAVSVEELK